MHSFTLLLPSLLLFITFNCAAKSTPFLAANHREAFYRHLSEVNRQWSWASAYIPQDIALQPIEFDNDIERIKTHLLMVEQVLRQADITTLNKQQIVNRQQCLSILHQYAMAAEFPRNLYHDSRSPYFIDDRQVACAVGFLMIKTGFAAIAQQISRENNYAYLCELLVYPQVQAWAANYGFSADELALIQPSYAPINQYLLYADGDGTDGTIYAMHTAPDNTLLIGGDFDHAGGIACHNFVCRTPSGFVPLGNGLNGTVRSISTFGGSIYAGGLFSNGSTLTANLARWNGSYWAYSNVADGSAILALTVHNNSLYAAGDFGVQKRGTAWLPVGGTFNGTVNVLHSHNGFLLAGGNFTQIDGQNMNHIAIFNNTAWQNIGAGLNAPVYALQTLNGELYAGGSFFNNGQAAFGLAQWNNISNQWQNLIYAPSYAPAINEGAIYSLQAYGNRLLIGGDFGVNGGKHLTYYDTTAPNGADLPALIDFFNVADAVYCTAIWGEYLYIGGALTETWTYDDDFADMHNLIRSNIAAVEVPIHLNLQGAFEYATGQMRNILRQYNLLPLMQPFSGMPWQYGGNESVLSYNQIPDNAVDWVLVEARNADNVNQVTDSRAAWLLSNGTVSDISGGNAVRFYNLERGGSYVFSVRHRNHLAVMRSVANIVPTPQTLTFAEPSLVVGGNSQLVALPNGSYGLCAGDFNADGIITVADFNCFNSQLSEMNQYLNCDADLNRSVTTSDFNLYMANTSRIGVSQIRY